MSDETGDTAKKNDRAEKVVKELLEHGWQAETVGARTVVYHKPAPIREREPSENAKTKEKK